MRLLQSAKKPFSFPLHYKIDWDTPFPLWYVCKKYSDRVERLKEMDEIGFGFNVMVQVSTFFNNKMVKAECPRAKTVPAQSVSKEFHNS